ncbi:DNA recombination protein RmuC [Lutispora thermophila]|uniref:DNA recombination protein RmuC n=1 Tax=Lutispora thermophila DSM 19022 TaxID=1122184 RepID=A0A1M6BP14_9FIRM|nr:DNA recombination protein RmuC [Lutispora thermophila]SHI50465.1 DNA recombination protein RmuC [Lutispora thermophila DSM 19022]
METILQLGAFIISLLVLLVMLAERGSAAKRNEKLKQEISAVESKTEYLEKALDKLEKTLREEMVLSRGEVSNSMKGLSDSLISRINEMSKLQHMQVDSMDNRMARLAQTNEEKLEAMRKELESKLNSIMKENSEKLEAMRITVDEKLNDTLEKRLGDSFKLVSERLEQVHKGLGEMQILATGVGDLKKVLTNVKTRGIWGEIQLGNILEQILTPEQYYTNISTKKNSLEKVEFAIRLPGKGGDGEEVLLPIDAKFPQEDFYRMVEAGEKGDPVAMEEAAKQLENRIKAEAKRISEKYINPPVTTDFAIMFLPIESLYAEVAKRAGLMEHIQEKYKINISGPSTMAAFLNSLSMGFRTLAIQRRSSEVWALLGTVKSEFAKFGDILDKTNKKLQEATKTIEAATKKTRTIERKLKDVEALPLEESALSLDTDELMYDGEV